MKKIKKLLAVVTIVCILMPNLRPANALSFGDVGGLANALIGAVGGIIEGVFEALNIAPEGFEYLTEFTSIAKNKNDAPEVSLNFSPTNPKFGETVTATAHPLNFKDNDTDSLYFTWYLKHDDGSGTGSTTINGVSYKTKNGNVDWDKNGRIDIRDYKITAAKIIAAGNYTGTWTYNGKSDNDDDGVEGLGEEVTDGESDNNTTALPFGGVGTKEPESGFRCFVKDYSDGVMYEIIDGDVSEENKLPEDYEEGYWGERGVYDFDVDGCSICGEDQPAEVKTCSHSYTIQNTCSAMDRAVEDENILWFGDSGLRIKIPFEGEACDVCVFCDGVDTACGVFTEKSLGEDDPGDYEGEGSLCEHLFPHAPGFTTGDGKFSDDEEKFWGTDPNNPDTNGDGINDESSVAGIGMDTMSWEYSPGDEVGVVVEGLSGISTKYADGGYMVMWALPENNFDSENGDCSLSNKQLYTTSVHGVYVQIPAANIDMNKCLEENLVNPMDGTSSGSMSVSLDYSPTNPSNNYAGGGDTLTLNAFTEAENGDESIYYKWTIQGSDSETTASSAWTDLSSDSNFRSLTGLTYLEGLGLNSISLILNISEPPKYLRAVVEAEEYSNSDVVRKGSASAIISLNSNSESAISLSSNTSGGVICEGETVCEAVNNQVLSASVDSGAYKNVSWSVNGNNGGYTSQGAEGYSTSERSNQINFPVIGNPGDTYILSVVANNVGSDSDAGKSLNATRVIQIVKPTLQLTVSGAKPKVNGQYLGLDGEMVDDESSTMFISSGGEVTVSAEFTPSWLEPVPEIDWSINGSYIESTGTSISFSPEDYGGGTVSVSASADYVQSNDSRQALKEGWGVSQFSSSEISMSDEIKVKTESDSSVAMADSSETMPNIFSLIPMQAVFLLRLSLTMIVILVVSGLIMSFGQQRQ